jgi:hypothetical protein
MQLPSMGKHPERTQWEGGTRPKGATATAPQGRTSVRLRRQVRPSGVIPKAAMFPKARLRVPRKLVTILTSALQDQHDRRELKRGGRELTGR